MAPGHARRPLRRIQGDHESGFGDDGSLSIVENATGGLVFAPGTGRLSRVAPDCSRTVLMQGLDRPTAVAVGADGAIDSTHYGATAAAGDVLKIMP
jgi:hypothetical protein